MGKRQFALSALGFVQAMGFASQAAAQGFVFSDELCHADQVAPVCQDNGCLGTTLDAQCDPIQGMFQDPITGEDVQGDGCICQDPTQAPPRCVDGQDPLQNPICIDIECGQLDPALHCDPLSCNCVPTQDPNMPDPNTPDPNGPTQDPDTPVGFDHYKCYKVKTDQKFKGVVNLDAFQTAYGLDDSCKIKKATKFCVPVMKTVTELSAKNTMTPNPAFMGHDGDYVDDLICYKIKCELPPPGNQEVNDQFGDQRFEKLKAFELCTPAEKGLAQ